MSSLPTGLDDATYKRALTLGKLAAQTYDRDDVLVAKLGFALFVGISGVKQYDYHTTPNYTEIKEEGSAVDTPFGDSGLDYTLFQGEEDGDLVLAFRGTEPLSVVDWGEDIKQALSGIIKGQDGQYEKAVELAMNKAQECQEKGQKLSFTGHSLGGGLATAAALATGHEAIVFDAAGVSEGTIEHIKKVKTDVDIELNAANITNFNVRECFVSDPSTPLGGVLKMLRNQQYGDTYRLKSVSEEADFIGLPDRLRTVKIAESILNHAWHVYAYQLEHKHFDLASSLETKTPRAKKQKLEGRQAPSVTPVA